MTEEEKNAELKKISEEFDEIKNKINYMMEKFKLNELKPQEKAASENSAPEDGEISADKADGA